MKSILPLLITAIILISCSKSNSPQSPPTTKDSTVDSIGITMSVNGIPDTFNLNMSISLSKTDFQFIAKDKDSNIFQLELLHPLTPLTVGAFYNSDISYNSLRLYLKKNNNNQDSLYTNLLNYEYVDTVNVTVLDSPIVKGNFTAGLYGSNAKKDSLTYGKFYGYVK